VPDAGETPPSTFIITPALTAYKYWALLVLLDRIARSWYRNAMRLPMLVPTALWLLLVSGCARITFHDAAEKPAKTNVGVEYYNSKPYLLVAQTAEKGYTASLITIPDVAHPRRAFLHPGYGTSNLSMQLSNGMLTNVGQQGDTQIPQTITALGGLISPVGGIIKGPMASAPSTAPSGGQPPFWLYEIVADGQEIKLRQVQLEQISAAK
jgi:hypothetical protein